MKSRYTAFHALVAIGVLGLAVAPNFWHNFLYGAFATPPRASALLTALSVQIALTGLLLLALWGSTVLLRRQSDERTADILPKPSGLEMVQTVLKAFVPVCLGAFALEGVSILLFTHVFHLPVHGQDLVTWLKPGTYPLGMRLVLIVFAIFGAPLLEEPLFRGVIFRGLRSALPLPVALIASGLAFAVFHVNASTVLPLMFLGVVFAWLYHRTGTILVPMLLHLLFNLLNLVLLFSGITE